MLEIQSLEDQLVKKDSSFDSFPADGALRHPVSAHLASPVAAQEDHVLQAVKAHWTHRLEKRYNFYVVLLLQALTGSTLFNYLCAY